eukprot:765057-Hanusia_phi.AAC.1
MPQRQHVIRENQLKPKVVDVEDDEADSGDQEQQLEQRLVQHILQRMRRIEDARRLCLGHPMPRRRQILVKDVAGIHALVDQQRDVRPLLRQRLRVSHRARHVRWEQRFSRRRGPPLFDLLRPSSCLHLPLHHPLPFPPPEAKHVLHRQVDCVVLPVHQRMQRLHRQPQLADVPSYPPPLRPLVDHPH